MRARFIPRILKADPKSLLNEAGDNLDPAKILAVMMRNEKSGGHSERSVGIGTIEVAVWDAVAKIEGKPLHRVLAERYNGGKVQDKVFCYVGGGWYAPGKTTQGLAGRDAPASRFRLHHGEDEGRRHAARRRHEPRRGGEDRSSATAASLRSTPTRKFDRDEAIAYAKALSPYKLRWYEEPCDPLDFATLAEVSDVYDGALSTGENLFSTQDVENLVRFGGLKAARGDVIQVDPPQAYGIVQYARTLDMLARHNWPRSGLFPHGGNQMSLHIAGGFGLGGAESYPGVFGAVRRLRRRRASWRTAISSCPTGPASASRARPRSTASCATSPRSAPSRKLATLARRGCRNDQAADLEGPAQAGAAAAAAVRP